MTAGVHMYVKKGNDLQIQNKSSIFTTLCKENFLSLRKSIDSSCPCQNGKILLESPTYHEYNEINFIQFCLDSKTLPLIDMNS